MAIYSPKENACAADFSLACMVGCALTKIDDSAAPNWVFHFDDLCALSTEGIWRLVHDSRIWVAGNDHDQMFGFDKPMDAGKKASEAIGCKVVEKAKFDSVTGDLYITFGEDTCLQVLTNSCGCESWTLFRPDDTQLVALGGGKVMPYVADAYDEHAGSQPI